MMSHLMLKNVFMYYCKNASTSITFILNPNKLWIVANKIIVHATLINGLLINKWEYWKHTLKGNLEWFLGLEKSVLTLKIPGGGTVC